MLIKPPLYTIAMNESMEKAIEQILEEGLTAPHQQESRLAIMADADASLGGYIAAYGLSDDALMKHRHFQMAIEVARQNPTRMNYSRAYLFCKDIGKDEMAEQLLNEMWEKYPIYSIFNTLPLRMAGLIRRDAPPKK